jgi:hypothetical protein
MKCEICNDGKDYNKLANHLRMKHNLSEDEYNQQVGSKIVEESFEEVEEDTSVTDPLKIRDNIFDVPQEYSLEMTLGAYLEKRKFKNLAELNSLVDRYMKGSAIDVTYQLKRNEEVGEQGADSLKDQDRVETKNLNIAETLVKKYGFVVTNVSGVKPNKVWKLKKK